MYISDNFVYTELHKTAGTHICKWLKILSPGEQVGKHNVIPEIYRDRIILGSVRNPWDWYVSLWGYGCDQKGSVWFQTIDKINFRYYRQQLPTEMSLDHLPMHILLRQLHSDIFKPIDKWKDSYKDSTNPDCFKAWLKLLFNKQRKMDVREGYGFSPIAEASGLLSYRFIKLFTNLGNNLYSNKFISLKPDLKILWQQHKIVNHFIRMEHLESDLIEAMKLANVTISSPNIDQLLAAKNNKTNTSSRLPTKHYFDKESIQLIYDQENFLIDLFNYQPPKI